MGRHKLDVPNAPISASIPVPLLRQLRSICSTHSLEWRVFIQHILERGLKAAYPDSAAALPIEGARHE